MNPALKTTFLLALLTGILLGVGYLIGGNIGLTIALVLSLVMNFGSWFWSDKIALAMYKAKPSTNKELNEIVRNLSHKAGLPMPKVYIIPTSTPNAFATGRDPKHASVAATEGLLGLLDKKELEGVIAHELAHIKNRDILIATVAATIAGTIGYIATMAQWTAIFGGDEEGNNIFTVLILAILAPIIAMIIQLAISRSREYKADDGGKHIIGNGESLARALEKLESANKHNPMKIGSEAGASLFIVNPFSGKALTNLFSTHPSTKERVARLRA
jgi:heat shock protein HtpX